MGSELRKGRGKRRILPALRDPRRVIHVAKRAERLDKINPLIDWPDNVWMGVTIENDDYTYRADHLRKTDAHVKFLSLEPLLGPLDTLDLTGIDWAIVGGESGPGARPMEAQWAEQIRERCDESGVAFFFKQWGGVNKARTGRLLNGRTWDEMPRLDSSAARTPLSMAP